MKLLLTLLLGVVCQLSAQATIVISEVVPSGPDRCDGGFTILANGSAGPFKMRIANRDGAGNDLVVLLPIEKYSLNDLCGRVYTIDVFPAGHPSCRTSFSVNLVTGSVREISHLRNSTGKRLSADGAKEQPLDFVVAPNPVRDEATLSWATVPKGLTTDATAQLHVYRAGGELAKTYPVKLPTNPATGGVLTKIDCTGLPPGIYILHLRIEDLQARRKLIIQR